jgi:hypothetical protein
MLAYDPTTDMEIGSSISELVLVLGRVVDVELALAVTVTTVPGVRDNRLTFAPAAEDVSARMIPGSSGTVGI